MNFHKIVMKGKMILEKLASNPVHSASDEGRFIYNTNDETLYYASSTGWESLATQASSAAGSTEVTLDVWHPDDEKDGVHTGNLWNSTPTIGFSPFEDGAIWTDFRMRSNWLASSDVVFKLDYAMSSTDTGSVSLNADIWVVGDGDKLDEDNPTVTAEDEIDPPSTNTRDILELTNIKINASNITTTNSNIVIKLWRDVDGVSENHDGWLEMVRLVAYQA